MGQRAIRLITAVADSASTYASASQATRSIKQHATANQLRCAQETSAGTALHVILAITAAAHNAVLYQDACKATDSMTLLAIASLSRFAHKIYAGTAPHAIL
jgi:hypothetical protein